MYKLAAETPTAWADCVLDNFDAFLVDHAACERKAGAAAEHYAVRYHDKPELIDVTIELARDELAHFHRVFRIMRERGLQLTGDEKEPYVNNLLKHAHSSGQPRLLDRLLIGSVTEFRGCERFALLSRRMEERREAGSDWDHGGRPDALIDFFKELAADDSRHRTRYWELAHHYFDDDRVDDRLEFWVDREAQVVESLPMEPRLFSGIG